MRIARLARKVMPLPVMRAGVPPLWDRPDPPASDKPERTRRFTIQQMHFSFFDASSPTYMLIQTEVTQQGIDKGFPRFLKGFAGLAFWAIMFGAAGYLFVDHKNVLTIQNFANESSSLEEEKKQFETKYGLQDMKNNPWKLNAWPQSFPFRNYGEQGLSRSYAQREKSVQAIVKINKQARAYLASLRAQAEESIKNGGSHHH